MCLVFKRSSSVLKMLLPAGRSRLMLKSRRSADAEGLPAATFSRLGQMLERPGNQSRPPGVSHRNSTEVRRVRAQPAEMALKAMLTLNQTLSVTTLKECWGVGLRWFDLTAFVLDAMGCLPSAPF